MIRYVIVKNQDSKKPMYFRQPLGGNITWTAKRDMATKFHGSDYHAKQYCAALKIETAKVVNFDET